MKFSLYKKENRLHIRNEHLYREFIDSLDEGQEIKAEFIKSEDERSLEQNSLYWRILTLIADTYGDLDIGPLKWHEYFKSKWLCYTENILGEEVVVCKSTAKLTIKEFSDYIEKIVLWAADKMQIVVISSDERLSLKILG